MIKIKQKSRKIWLILLAGTLFFLLLGETYSQSLLLPLEYISLIQQKIDYCFIYPPQARLKGWEGIVKVRFILTQDGRIKEIDIAESSGYPLLDAAAILAVRDASPYPFPNDYPEEELEIILPISYKKDEPLKDETLPEQETLTSVPALVPAPVEEPKESPPPKEETPPPQELEYFVDLALKNNQPTKVAREEIELAQFNVIEAKRNLFPALKISGYTTAGEVYKIDYEEWESKIELTQPLFYTGKLIDTVKQARVNLEITKRNYDRLKLDVIQKTETAYYNLVAANMHLKLKEELLKEAQELRDKVEKLSAAGMVTPLEVSSARAHSEHIRLQIDSIKHDLFMAELTFQQVLNVKEIPKVETLQLQEAKKLDIDLSTCKETAFHYRPEIYLSELLIKFNDYSQKIQRSESNAFTVDLTSSYGYYKGHYKTEPWKDSSNWFAGVKVSRPFGASTLNTSYNTEETQPRFGQTSPTASSTISGEFNLLDNMKRVSEKKKSDIDILRSLSDFDETWKTIAFEVQDAFLNYQKAILQLNAACIEMGFRQNEKEVTKIRALAGETSLASVLDSLFNLSEAQTKYIQSLANYHISLANLRKATGYAIEI